MANPKILDRLANKKIKPEKAAEEVANNFKLLDEIIEGISSDKATVRFGCAKILQILSRKHPEQLYLKWNFYVKLLDHKNNILKWNAIIIIANLTRADKDKRFEKIFDKYFGLIKDPKMITAANVVGHSAIIAKAKPELTEKITKKLLEVEKGKWETSECKNIVLGKTILAFGEFFDQIKGKEKMIEVVKRQLDNSRNATKKKAEEFLGKYHICCDEVIW